MEFGSFDSDDQLNPQPLLGLNEQIDKTRDAKQSRYVIRHNAVHFCGMMGFGDAMTSLVFVDTHFDNTLFLLISQMQRYVNEE